MNDLRSLPALLALASAPCVNAQLTVQNNLTPEQLVTNILTGQGINVSNVTLNGQPGDVVNDQMASFDGTSSNIGFADGIILCTGKAIMAAGPNDPSFPGQVAPDHPRNQRDPDLDRISGFNQSGVVALEFDFVPTGDSVSFRFVFGSEEYRTFVCSPYNDVFGFFLSGPGINGVFTNNGVNLGSVPNKPDIPVCVNSINPGTPGMGRPPINCDARDPGWRANSIYYVDNPAPPLSFPPGPNNTTVQFNGFTVPLHARARVQCGETYHIKMIIANIFDTNLDSGVFIEGHSFSSTPSPITITATTPLGDGILTEGCGEAMITLSRPASGRDADVTLSYRGAGVTAEDLEGMRTQVTIPGSEERLSFPIGAVRDQLVESGESVTITASWTNHCGNTMTDSITLQLQDYIPLAVTAEDVWLRCDRDSVLLDARVSGGLGNVMLAWGDEGRPAPFYASGWDDRTYEVIATDQCPATASAVVRVSSGCTIWSPNVITPNGDGVNDAWVINGLAMSGSSVKVFNRWGNEVYASANYANNWEGKGLPDGTYYYEVIDGRKGDRITGYLTILANARP